MPRRFSPAPGLRIAIIALHAFAALLSSCAQRQPDELFAASAEKLRPAVVLLTMSVPGETHKNADTEFATGIVVASGPWGSDVLTVEHALENAWNFHVTANDRRKWPARVIARSHHLDVALLRTPAGHLTVMKLGATANARPGLSVGLLGYPIPDAFAGEGLGLTASLNSGRVSALRRDAIELTVTIVPGESGGPVFLSDTGEVIGLAQSRFEEERSIGFALPIDDVKRFLRAYDRIHGF